MSDILWSNFDQKERDEYVRFLQIFGALSGLFKDIENGKNAKKPYLYYRNHEQLYARVFNVEDLTRKDSAFDAVFLGDLHVGIGLKTWFHGNDFSYQKVAEFNKKSGVDIRPYIENGDFNTAIQKISELRNERIMFDKRLYQTTQDIYHYVTRDDYKMNIIETNYDLVQLDQLQLLGVTDSSLSFTDGLNQYRYSISKSTLMEEFDASNRQIITSVPIQLYDDPFELLGNLVLPSHQDKKEYEEIYLPLYSDVDGKVQEKSGLNASLASSKVAGSNKPRPEYEAYIGIPSWIHRVFPEFFGVDLKQSTKVHVDLELHLPDGSKMKAIVSQSNGKSLQTNPQNVLGKWILKSVFDLKPYQRLTLEMLERFGVDSVHIIKLSKHEYKIDFASFGAFEKWKDSQRELIIAQYEQDNKTWRLPKFRLDSDLEDE